MVLLFLLSLAALTADAAFVAISSAVFIKFSIRSNEPPIAPYDEWKNIGESTKEEQEEDK